MNKLISFVIAVMLVSSGYIALRGTDIKSAISDFSQQSIYIQRDQNVSFVPDWSSSDVLQKINSEREASGVSKLTESTVIDQSAKARLSVILSEDDFDGLITGITREKSLVNVGYEANLVGELIVLSFYKTNDPVAFWINNPTSKGTLIHPDFMDVGIAIKNSSDRVDVYIILASPRRVVKAIVPPKISWGGIELWESINKRRVESGVNPLKQRDELCTIASIRLNQLLELGKLDGHEGFDQVINRDDLKWISEKYSISEYLIQGYPTPFEAVEAWENTLGHRSLLAGGEFVWGCVYAQNTFGVAIAAY